MATRTCSSVGALSLIAGPPSNVGRVAKFALAAAFIGLFAADVSAQLPPGAFRVRRGGLGQPMVDGAEEQTAEGLFHGDRETRKQLKKAKKLLEDKRFSEALPLLDDILESSQDYFDITEENQTARNGLKFEAQRLIGEQSPEGLQAYETLFGAKAERMLSDALSAGDLSAVAEVARRYFHTKAGYDATLLLGRHQLDHDQPLAAALCFQRLLASPAAEKLEPGLSVMLAACWLRGGLEDRARQTLADLKKRDPGATVKIAGKDVKLFTAADEVHALSWLNEKFGGPQSGSAVAEANWAMVRGNPARNAVSAGGIPLLNPRWRSSIAPTREVKEAMANARQESADRNLTTIPVMQPLAVGDCVLARAPSGLLFGIDFRTGKKVWDNHLHIQQQTERPPSVAMIRPGVIVNMQDPFGDRLWENATCGTISSDGQFVFEVEEIPDSAGAGMQEMTRRRLMLRGGMAGLGLDHPTNKLAAYEPSTEGKIKWCVGGEVTDFEPSLTGAFFLGPPLPLFGKLYVLAEIKGEIRLIVLDAKTGKLDWSQQLASPEDPNVIGSGFRRTTGVSPSYADGILICPTSAGAIVAVDIANRMLLWGYEYPRSVQTPQQQQVMAIRMGAMVNMNALPSFFGDRWADATATIAEGCVVLTPVESEQLFCLSLLDGKLRWKAPREEYIYVAGVHDGQVVVVGRKQLQAFRLADGKPAWPNPLLLPQGTSPSGRGFVSGGHYFLPLSSAEVASIDLAAGKIDARVKSRKGVIPGNLICYKGTVISQGIDSIDEFFQLEPLEQSVAKALAANPNDSAALADRGNAELDKGKIAEAIADVRKSYEQKPIASTRELLVEALLTDLDRDFAASRGTVGELEKLVVLDSERTAFLRTLSQGLDKAGDRLGSLDAYLKLIDLSSVQSDPEVVNNQLSVRRDRWVRARLERLYSAASGDERTKFDAAVTERLSKALGAKQAKELRRFLAFFGFHPAADEAREQLFAQLGGQESWIERESLLDQLQRSPDPARRRAAIAQMGAFLNDANKYDEAAVFYRRLEREFPDEVCMSGKTGKQLVESLPAESPLKRAVADAAAWPEGSVRRDAAEPRGFGQNHQSRPFPLAWRGSRPEFLETVGVSFDQQNQILIGRDGVGRERFRVQINEQNRGLPFQQISPELNFVSAQGHLLLVNLGSEVLAIDTLRNQGNGNRVLWTQELSELAPNMFNGQPVQATAIALPWGATRHVPAQVKGGQSLGIVGPLLDRCVFVERGHDLTAYDPLTGETLWSRRGIEPGSEVFGDAEALVIVPPDTADESVKATIYRSLDGEELGTRTLPKSMRRWAYCGRRCLEGRVERDGRLSFVLSDPWEEKDTVLATFKSGVKATLVGDDAAAFLEPSGHFLMVALADGKRIIDEQLEPEDALDNIVVQRTPDQYVLFANRALRGTTPNMPTPQGMVGLDSGMAPANGHIYAFDRGTGKSLWPVPALVKNYHVLLGQGVDLPLLVLLHWHPVTGAAGPGEAKSSLLCLDRRSGRLVWKEDLSQPANFFNCEIGGSRERQTVTVTMPTQAIALRFTNDPVPPEPPYQAGLLTEPSPFGQNPAAAILKAIGGATREIGGEKDPFGGDDDGK